jgi:hypothetical protein
MDKISKIFQLDPFSNGKDLVFVDWDYALTAVATLDKYASDENRNPIKGKAAINILAEYGAIAYRCSGVPDRFKLAIVVSPPFIFFCPSPNGLDGIFVEDYSEDKHGKSFMDLEKDNLFAYTNIDARLDGWSFAAGMVELARSQR